MSDDQRLDLRIYCTKCDSYRPRKMFQHPTDSWCSPCRTINLQRYTRNLHDRAIFALGGQCMECTLPYDPDDRIKTRLHMMKLPGYNHWLGKHANSQYGRDKRIVEEADIAKRYIRMLCTKCKPKFESIV